MLNLMPNIWWNKQGIKRKEKKRFFCMFQFQLDTTTPSPHKPSLWITAFALEANSWTESSKILFATSSPASAQDTTTGTSAAMRAQDGSA